MEKLRILHIKNSLPYDGATIIEYRLAEELKDEFAFDWFLISNEEGVYEERFRQLGGQIFHCEYFKRKLSTLGQIYYNRMDLVYRYENKNDLLPQLFLNSPRMINGFRVFGIQSFCSSRNIVNGIKFLLGPCRWLLIRSSETEDIIRFYAEGQSEKETEMLLSCGREILGI